MCICTGYTNVSKVVISILQGSVVTQTVLGGLTVLYLSVANFLQCICATNYESLLRLGSCCNNKLAYIFGQLCRCKRGHAALTTDILRVRRLP